MSAPQKRRGPLTIELRKPYTRLAGGGAAFALCAAFLANKARGNDRGLVINGIIHLDPGSADVFYAVLAVLSVGFVLMSAVGIRALLVRATYRVVVGKKHVTLPRVVRFWEPSAEEDVKIAYDDLISLALAPPGAPVLLTITQRGGPPAYLRKYLLPEGFSLGELAELIAERARIHAEQVASGGSEPSDSSAT